MQKVLAEPAPLATAARAPYDPREQAVSGDPWTDPDPQPGDFDAELATLDSNVVEIHEGDCKATMNILVDRQPEPANGDRDGSAGT